MSDIEIRPGDLDRRGRGVAWTAYSRRLGRVAHMPSDKEFAYFLKIEFDPDCAKFVEQPVIRVTLPDEHPADHHAGSFYVERRSGRRELHVLTGLKRAAIDKTISPWLIEHGFHIIEVADSDDWTGTAKRRNLTRLLSLVGDAEPAVDVCVTVLKDSLRRDAPVSMATLLERARKAGYLSHIGARAVAILVHQGALTADLDGSLIDATTMFHPSAS